MEGVGWVGGEVHGRCGVGGVPGHSICHLELCQAINYFALSLIPYVKNVKRNLGLNESILCYEAIPLLYSYFNRRDQSSSDFWLTIAVEVYFLIQKAEVSV